MLYIHITLNLLISDNICLLNSQNNHNNLYMCGTIFLRTLSWTDSESLAQMLAKYSHNWTKKQSTERLKKIIYCACFGG